ncbi:hypothetical protein [Exiguobacterium sp. s191]|uniref:hypothetical protein n=1 Tax=Exiguobacterium sp. s191 TaxID=2751196 RepID=UPI001BEA892C|nr:hypothetical protein [Exiguobacterium sp. s191]
MKSYRITKQVGPTCGIYAFLNGLKVFYDFKELDDKIIHRVVLELLKENEIPLNEESDEGKISTLINKRGMTFIGEFFNINNYVKFLEKSQKKIFTEIKNSQNLNIEIKKIKISEINDDKNTFYISPVLRKNRVSKKVKAEDANPEVLHWISHQFFEKECRFMARIKEENHEKKTEDVNHTVIDSNKKRTYLSTLKDIIDENIQLQGKEYKWRGYEESTRKRKVFKGKSKRQIDSWVAEREKYKTLLGSTTYTPREVVMIKKL